MRNPNDERGEAGSFNALVTVTLPSAYFGGGIAGYVRGKDYYFYARTREGEFTRPRLDMTHPPFRAGIGDSAGRRVSLTIYYKGDDYPPNFELYEYLLFEITFGGDKSQVFVLMVETFRQVGDVDRAVEYVVSGETDGIFQATGF